jgi:hypothetical protein
MPQPRIHELIDEILFGRSYFKEVHSWIDGTFNGTNGRIHWKNRHFIQAILEHFNTNDYPNKEERERFIFVAKLHVLMDFMWYYKQIVIPETYEDVIRELERNGIFIER